MQKYKEVVLYVIFILVIFVIGLPLFFILRKKDFRLKQHLQYGEVFKSNEYKEGQLCLFSPYRQIETERGIFDVVRDGGVALTYDKKTKVVLR